MTYRFTEEMFNNAVITADDIFIESFPKEYETAHTFSNEFERKMKKLIRQSRIPASKRKTFFVLHKRVVAVLVAIMVLLASAMSVSAIRERVFAFMAQVYEKYSLIFFEKTGPALEPDSDMGSLVAYIPKYIPDGFELSFSKKGQVVFMLYEKGSDTITFEQHKIEDFVMDINTEGVDIEEFEFNKCLAKYYSNQGKQNLIWYDDLYVFRISSTLDKDIVLKIAENVVLKE